VEITKESFLKAEDPKNRDAMLFDMLDGISVKIDKANEIEDRVQKCEGNITCLGRIGAVFTTLLGIMIAWFKLL